MKKTNLFNVLKDVFVAKTGKLHQCFNFHQVIASTYLFQRWISMESSSSAYMVNATTNRLWRGLGDDKETWYKLLTVVLGKKNFHKINYIKKSEKVISEARDKEVEELARCNEISKREALEYWEMIDKLKRGHNAEVGSVVG